MLTATRPDATGFNEALLGDMYLRIERLEAEVTRLRAAPPRPGTEALEDDAWADHSLGEDGSSTDTRPVIALGHPTPRENAWPAPRATLRDTPHPAGPLDANDAPDHDLLRVAFDLNPDAVVGVDGRGRVRLWNRAAVTMFGWSADEVLGSPPPFLPADRHEEHASLVRYPRSVIAGQELATVRRNRLGEPVPVRLSVSESRCGGVVFALRADTATGDRTPDPRPAMEPADPAGAAVTLAGDATAGAMVTLGRAAAGAVHDFNNLLTAVLGFAGLLREQFDAADPADRDGHDLATDILAAAELGGELCRTLLGVTRPTPGTPAQTDLTSHVARHERLVRKLAGARTTVRLDLAAGLPSGQIPHAEFAQVLLNLAKNAAEAMDPVGGTLTIRTAAETVPPGRADWPAHVAPGRYVVLAVSDRGPGTGLNRDAAGLRDLCRPGATGRPETNHGLGLAIVGDILDRHGGHLTLEADALTGTTFRVYLREA